MKGPFKYLSDRFPYPFIHTLGLVKSLPYHIPDVKKEPLFGGASPYRPLQGVPPLIFSLFLQSRFLHSTHII